MPCTQDDVHGCVSHIAGKLADCAQVGLPSASKPQLQYTCMTPSMPCTQDDAHGQNKEGGCASHVAGVLADCAQVGVPSASKPQLQHTRMTTLMPCTQNEAHGQIKAGGCVSALFKGCAQGLWDMRQEDVSVHCWGVCRQYSKGRPPPLAAAPTHHTLHVLHTGCHAWPVQDQAEGHVRALLTGSQEAHGRCEMRA